MTGTHIILDLDGTVADCRHRQHFAQAGEWDDFHKRCEHDATFSAVADLVRTLNNTTTTGAGIDADVIEFVALTGRTEDYRKQTIDWLQNHDLFVDHLLMRQSNDFKSDVEMKIELLELHYGSKEKVLSSVWFVLEDRDKVVDGLRNYGLEVWQVRPGGY